MVVLDGSLSRTAAVSRRHGMLKKSAPCGADILEGGGRYHYLAATEETH
jgi:hypothetical protein